MTSSNRQRPHQPVLVTDVVHALQLQPGARILDCTFGAGGHARALLEACPLLELSAVDRDPCARAHFDQLQQSFPKTQMRFFHASFSDVAQQLLIKGETFQGILADLGMSSMQIDEASRGFSFQKEGPLDLRMDPSQGMPASEWLMQHSEGELVDVLTKFGEEPLARMIARDVISFQNESGPITTTTQLSKLVEAAYKRRYRKPSRTPAAAKTFQAIRIALNEEFGELENLLKALPQLLAPQGRATVISFHSLEDRMVKHCFQRESKNCRCPPHFPVCQCHHRAQWIIIKPFPLKPSQEEITTNPRSRSALLRVVQKL